MTAGRRAPRATAIALTAVLALAGCSDDDAASPSPSSSSTSSTWVIDDPKLDRCTTRLAYDAAIYSLNRLPVEEPGLVARLRQVEPPADVAEGWPDLLAAAAAGDEQGVELEDIADGDLSERALLVVEAIDAYVLEVPCDPEGLPASAGCRMSLRECAHAFARGDGATFATPFTMEAALLEDWDLLDCQDQQWIDEHGYPWEPRQQCEIGHALASGGVHGNRYDITFMQTTDARWFAWTVE